jgi:hypothetical protein
VTDLIPKNATLEHCETIIETNLAGAFAVASALSHIHDHKLYKATHKTWEVYCLERWQMSRSAAWRQIAQSRAVAELPAGSSAPSQRSLAKRPEQNVAHPPSEPPVTRDKAPKVRDEKSKPKSVVIDVESTDVPKSPEPSSALRIAELESEIVRMKNVLGTLANRRDSLPEWARDMLAPWVIVGMTVKKKAGGFDVKKGAAVGRGPAPRNPPPPARAATFVDRTTASKPARVKPEDCAHPITRRIGTMCAACGKEKV